MSNNRHEIENGLQHEFSDAGGHVNWVGQEFIEPVSAEESSISCVPDLIRWALENKGVNIVQGDMSLGHKTVNHWTKVAGIKVSGPNTYFGYAGWKP